MSTAEPTKEKASTKNGNTEPAKKLSEPTSKATPPPRGYKKRGTDLVGIFNPDEGLIHCIPRSAKVFDGNLDPKKPSTLIICELVEPCDAIFSKDEKIVTKAGDQVGVFYKPGMSAIKTLCGARCLIQYERDAKGEIVTKKMPKKGMNPMKVFEVLSDSDPMKTIPLLEDTRKHSAEVNTPFAPAKAVTESAEPDQSPDNGDEYQGDDEHNF